MRDCPHGYLKRQCPICEAESEASDLRVRLSAIERLVLAQAEDRGLWFTAATAAEAYLQQELRRLHAVIEAGTSTPDSSGESAHPTADAGTSDSGGIS